MIEATGLTKRYGDATAVRDVTFRVAKGEVLGFLGPNGAGKTTTMRMITGYLPPTDGTAAVDGFDVVERSLDARRRVGYLPETVPLYPELTVREYLSFVAEVKGVGRAARRSAVGGVLEAADVGAFADRMIRNLSKGTRQRVGIAQALVADPPVLVLDEPTIGLDPEQILQIRTLIRSLAADRTIILSTHILPEVSATCRRVLIIKGGRLLAQDRLEDLDRKLQGGERLRLRAGGPREAVLAALAAVPGVDGVRAAAEGVYEATTRGEEAARAALARAVARGGWDLYELRRVDLTLEDVYLRVIAEADAPAAGPAASAAEAAAHGRPS